MRVGEDRSAPPAWGEMETDCLVHVFQRLELEDLATAAPLVCREWSRATANPPLWRMLDLRRDHLARFMPGALSPPPSRAATSSPAGFLRLCVARAGSADELALPSLLASLAPELDLISAECMPEAACGGSRSPRPKLSSGDEARLPELIPRWRLLWHLELDSKPSSFPAVAAQLTLHCLDFSSLKASGLRRSEEGSTAELFLALASGLSWPARSRSRQRIVG